MNRVIVFAGICVAIVGLWAVFGSLPNIESLRSDATRLGGWKAANPLGTGLAYLGVYIAAAALSLPVAVWLTLGAGAIFGFGWGLVISSFGASIGALLAFLAARYLLRDSVEAKLGPRLQAIDNGLSRDGAFYLFTLRLIPAVPFFVVNLLMGLTRIPALTFYVVSQIGMLAGAAVYVNAGTQLASLRTASDILSLPMMLSFAALGLLPWAARFGLGRVKARRVYGRWTKPRSFDRNLVVIGAGSAGLVSAYIAAAVQARVTLVERGLMGGDCLNYGCVPSKALIRSAKAAHHIASSAEFGVSSAEARTDFPAVMARIRQVIAEIAPHDSVERYRGLGVDVRQGSARIVDPWTVEIAGDGGTERLTTRSIIIATGASPVVPPLPGLSDVAPLTSDTMWDHFSTQDRLPGRIVLLGGGPIGCELSQSFSRLGAEVTLIEMADRLLLREDAEVSEAVQTALRDNGVTLLTGHRALAAGRDDHGKWIEVEGPEGRSRIGFDEIIVAVGRVARLSGLGLEELGIPASRIVETNEYLETIYPNIYAAGDVAGPYQLTHAGAHQAWFAVVNALFGRFRRFRADYRVLPATTFTDPEVARVGLNEAEAAAKGIAYEVTRYGLDDLDRAIADGSATGWVKVLTVPGRDRILGATIVGDRAGDLLAEFALAMRHGLGLNRILSTVHSYPTLAEANKFAAGVWRRNHVNPTVLNLLRRYHAWARGQG